MPGPDFEGYDSQDLYPPDEEAYKALLTWFQQAFTAADQARQPYYEKWRRYDKLYRSYLRKKKGDWQSKVFIPYVFSVVETIVPKLVAQRPKFMSLPVGPEDVFPAQQIERLLDYSAENSRPNLEVELIKATKQSLKFGTGILKNYYDVIQVPIPRPQPIMQPVMQPGQPVIDPGTGGLVTDVTGAPIVGEPQPVIDPATGQPAQQQVGTQMVPVPQTIYEGPVAQWVDIFNFWVAPEAQDVQSARYVMERVYRPMSHILDQVMKGVYKIPDGMSAGDIANLDDEPLGVRRSSIELGSTKNDATRTDVEIIEVWTDDNRLITVANRKAILRVVQNPYWHRQKPYVRGVDYLVEGDFWGIGEVETIEGLQDVENAIINQRIDALRLTLNPMFGFNENAIVDPRDLISRPGGGIRVTNDRNPRDVLERIELGDVNPSAFAEAEQMEQLIERVTGASAYQMGTTSDAYNDTATGTAIVQEAGNSKFALKSRLWELLGLHEIANQWGALLQQFTTEERVVRLLGPDGQYAFETLQPDSILGAVDFSIETASSTQTESIRKQQALTMLQVFAGIAPQAVPQLLIDVLEAFGKKNIAAYLGPQAQQYALMMAQMQQQLAPGAPANSALGAPTAPGTPPGPETPQSTDAQGNVIPFPGQVFGQGPYPPQPPQTQIRETLR